MSKKRMGIFVVALIIVVLLGLGYYYTETPAPSADMVTIAVRGYLSVERTQTLGVQLNRYAAEKTGGGIELKLFQFPAAGGGETAQMLGRLAEDIKAGDSDLYLLDGYVYDLLGDERLFADLSARYPDDPAVTRKYLYAIAGKPFAGAQGLENLPELYLALRSAQLAVVNKNPASLEKYSQKQTLLDRIAGEEPLSSLADNGEQK